MGVTDGNRSVDVERIQARETARVLQTTHTVTSIVGIVFSCGIGNDFLGNTKLLHCLVEVENLLLNPGSLKFV